ncbi:Hypothetical predicted protein [Mytilus galloprovincialis]|uniref:Uncharacterized protein n=1 Tax=Mytilus galloprovincialis TaxID=29158 RepID=A0A8B6DWT3_MYTGA|nr:Hypothetical predicted protein [Mytilus galloprovincialis]
MKDRGHTKPIVIYHLLQYLYKSRRNGIADSRPIAQSPDFRYNKVARDTPVDRRPSVQSQDVRYNEVVRDCQVDKRPAEKSPAVHGRQPEAPTAESRYYKTDQRPADSISYRSSADIPRRSETRTKISRKATDYGIGAETIASESGYLKNSERNPPRNISYLKPLDSPSATVKTEYNYMKESKKGQQLDLLKLHQRVKEISKKKKNPYFKVLFENKTPELNKEKIPKRKDQCPIYKYTVEKDRIEIHTEPGRYKMYVIALSDVVIFLDSEIKSVVQN